MGKNLDGVCVMKPWTHPLSWKAQAVLLSALRGCDTAGKNDFSKRIVRRMRSVILQNGGTEECEFMDSDVTWEDVYAFSKNIDAYPVHFLLHLIHAGEVIGYELKEERAEAEFWRDFYHLMVSAFHMNPETPEQMRERLADGRDTCCHKT